MEGKLFSAIIFCKNWPIFCNFAMAAEWTGGEVGRGRGAGLPSTVPLVFSLMCVRAHHLDLEFYDRFSRDNAYLLTHANHMQRWHPDAPLVR